MSTGAGIVPSATVAGATSACLLQRPRSRRLPRVSCRQGSHDQSEGPRPTPLQRRGLLIAGLGGLCSVAAGPIALPEPVDSSKQAATEAKDELLRVEEFGTQPRRLDPAAPLRVLVARPKKSRTKAEKEQEVEVLQIDAIRVDPTTATRFDVYVAAARGDLAGPGLGELAGIFLKLPYKREDSAVRMAGLKLGLTALLDDMNADDAEKLVVSLVLRAGDATVGDVTVDLRKSDMARDM
ncbi:polyphenol oxidase [Musa troglodytarum]|uniref:Polyphenol oxidase n=1 Tax=Musa troglodytarum TaxID=320322 RepID=A0A9E7KYN3_9LILI|nr:polyphenol oxidase [Musa troglodytarum]